MSTLHLLMANAVRFATSKFMKQTTRATQTNQLDDRPQWSRQFVVGKSIHSECPYPTLRCDSALATNKENYLSILLYEM